MPWVKSKYPKHWKQLVASAMARVIPAGRTGPACQGCGCGHMEDGTNRTCLTTHHPDRDPQNPFARLTILCASCHLAVESIARAREKRIAALARAADQLTFDHVGRDQ